MPEPDIYATNMETGHFKLIDEIVEIIDSPRLYSGGGGVPKRDHTEIGIQR